MSVSCPDCGAVAGYGHEIGHKTDCQSVKKPFDFKTLRKLTPEEAATAKPLGEPKTREQIERMLTGQPDPKTPVTIYLPAGYHSPEEFAKDCGFEIAKPEPLPWDAYSNRHYEPVELRAQKIYERFDYDGPPGTKKPDWYPHGNGTKQDEARTIARRLLREAGHDPAPVSRS